MALALSVIVSAGLFALLAVSPASAQPVRVAGTGSGMGTMTVMADAYRKREAGFRLTIVQDLGSRGSLKALVAGALDLVVLSRTLSSGEFAQGLSAIEYGRTPFVFATSMKGIAGLTSTQAADMIAGRVTHWPDGSPIRVVLRPKSVVGYSILENWSPAIKEALETAHGRPGMIVAATDRESARQIARLPGSLGTSTLALALAERLDIELLAIDGVKPAPAAIGDKSYPLVRPMYLAMKGEGSPSVARFVRFVQSPDGRAELERIGYFVAPLRSGR